MLITTLKGRGRDHWRRWHGNRFATAHLKHIISWSVYLRKYFWHLLIKVKWYLSAYGHCSSERISLMLQMAQSSFCLTSAHIKRYLWSSAYARKYLWWCKMSFHNFFCNQVKQNIITKLAYQVSALKRVIWGKLIIILFHIIIIIICIFIINNHHHTTKCLKKYVFKRMLEPQRTHSIGSTLATCNINQTWPKKNS